MDMETTFWSSWWKNMRTACDTFGSLVEGTTFYEFPIPGHPE